MTKKERCLSQLRKYKIRDQELDSFLLQNSNLPGKRANLELAFAFGDYIAEHCQISISDSYAYCLKLIAENPVDKNQVGNEEFLPFCAIIGLGHIAICDESLSEPILKLLKLQATDSRWRIREAVVMAIQKIIEFQSVDTITYLRSWLIEESYLVHRAVAASVAAPNLLANPDFAQQALSIHQEIIVNLEKETSARKKDLQVLVKGLCYTLSIVVSGIGQQGFDYLESLIHSDNSIIRKIARENLKKKRLLRVNEKKTLELQQLIKNQQ